VNSVNLFNEYFFGKLKQTSSRNKQLAAAIQNFYQQGGNVVFECFLKAILFTMLFEENKNIWLFNKVLFSVVILVNIGGPGVL
jgi:hypothetical protein